MCVMDVFECGHAHARVCMPTSEEDSGESLLFPVWVLEIKLRLAGPYDRCFHVLSLNFDFNL